MNVVRKFFDEDAPSRRTTLSEWVSRQTDGLVSRSHANMRLPRLFVVVVAVGTFTMTETLAGNLTV